ncbi:uncharacterized protein [Primulina eburnea]|uniref:uncharacterized protein n=1 Tax=Primulina eburnea TaxID=1245227 RepID=UPI003C6C7E44
MNGFEAQIGQLAKMITSREPGTLPSNTKTNPKEQVKAIALRFGKVLEHEGKEKMEQRKEAADTSTDFVVLDIEEDREMPLILGRSFLATGKALIEVQEGKLRLRVGEEENTFDDTMKYSPEATLTTNHLNNDLEREQMKNIPYVFVVESLTYAQVFTRPEITFIVGMLGRYQSNPGLDHWKIAKKVMRYLQGTKDYMLMFRRTGNLEVIGYSNSNYDGCIDS